MGPKKVFLQLRRGVLLLLSLGLFVVVQGVQADAPPEEQFRERVEMPERKSPPPRKERRVQMDETGWGTRLSLGVTEAFFDEEDTETLPAMHLDIWNKEYPWNFRVGVEGGNHINLDQENAAPIAEAPGKTPQITFVRIPFALEYIMPVSERTRVFIGGGPDIIHTANDLSETDVGLHLGVRLGHDFNEHWGVSVEGGYWWGDVDSGVNDIELDSAYVTPQLTYTF